VLRRYSKESNGEWKWQEDYIYRGTQMLAAEIPDSPKTRHFHLDHLGTPRLITGNGGAEISRHTYHPFGEEIAPGPTAREKKQFTGHERDSESLDYMHARFYAPFMARFMSVDPAMDLKKTVPNPQVWNRYSYALNNPLRYTDPDGRVVVVDDLVLAGAAALALTALTADMAAPSATYPGKNNHEALSQSATDVFAAVGAAIGALTSTEVRDRREEPHVVIGESMSRVTQAAPQVPAMPLPGITAGPGAAAQSVVAVQAAITGGARIFDAGFDKNRKTLSAAYVAEIVTLRQNGYSPHRYREVVIDGKKDWVYEWRKDV
jgi:RHS repeat-associated protein